MFQVTSCSRRGATIRSMGTAALLKAAGVGRGDEVVVPAFGNVEVTEAAALTGAWPVFADIDPTTYCLDPRAVEAVLTPRTAAVVVVHRFGRHADIEALHALGARHGLLVLERRELGPLDEEIFRRREHAAYLDAKLRGVRTPDADVHHTYQQYVVRVPGNGRPDRDAFARALRAKGVGSRIPVQTPVHRLREYHRSVSLPETERASDETLALPVGGELSTRDIQKVVSACNALGGLLEPAL